MAEENNERKYSKALRKDIYEVLKQHYKSVRMYNVVGINMNKATIVVYDTVAPFDTLDDDTRLNFTSVRKIGDKMVLPIDESCIDDIIGLYGDVAACMFVKNGVIIGMLSFEELDVSSIQQAENFIMVVKND